MPLFSSILFKVLDVQEENRFIIYLSLVFIIYLSFGSSFSCYVPSLGFIFLVSWDFSLHSSFHPSIAKESYQEKE